MGGRDDITCREGGMTSCVRDEGTSCGKGGVRGHHVDPS